MTSPFPQDPPRQVQDSLDAAQDAVAGARDAITGAQGAEGTVQDASSLLAQADAVGWVDLTAIAIVLVFLVLGLFRGLVWQIGRIASLLLSYVAAGIWGAPVGERMSGLFSEGTDARLPLYVGSFVVFLGVLILVSLLTWALHKLVEKSGMGLYDRVAGGALGVATGALVVLALITGAFMSESVLGFGGGVVQAAEKSRSLEIGHQVLAVAEDILPETWRGVPQEWRILLHDERITPRADGLGGLPAGIDPKVLPGILDGQLQNGGQATPQQPPRDTGTGTGTGTGGTGR